MAPTINLILGVHNHQPVDNWHHVVEEATNLCYKPFLDVLERHPGIAMSIHFTGYLLDWLAMNRSDLMAQVNYLVKRGQVELITGGYYEPILATIPDADKVGQVKKLTERIKELFKIDAKGLWLAERVWEPQLVKHLAEAGVEYLCLDDTHFRMVGLEEHALFGRYTSEEQGRKVDIFPISKPLRYLIPYADPNEIVHYLLSNATEDGNRAAVYFDDGEKFGVWPGTHQWVYNEGWLDRFFGAIEHHSNVIKSVNPGAYKQKNPSWGRIYLPTCSYVEMMQWSMPPHQLGHMEYLQKHAAEDVKPFLRAGFWRHFLVKYPEANTLHKKMLYVSEKVQNMPANTPKELADDALDHLWKGQSNDVFWHGVFGGLYLTNLRSANYRHLILAEIEADKRLRGEQFFHTDVRDIDCDGQDEVLIETQAQNLYFSPREGGCLFELDYRPKAFNLLDTLARRYEAYHEKIKNAYYDDGYRQDRPEEGQLITKEPNLGKYLQYDWHRRASLMDHFLGADTNIDWMATGSFPEQGDFVTQPYTHQLVGNTVTLERNGCVWHYGHGHAIHISKAITVDKQKAAATIQYTITNKDDRALDLWFAPEFNINLLAPDAPDRYFYRSDDDTSAPTSGGTAVATEARVRLVDPRLVSKGVEENVLYFGALDEYSQIDYRLTFDKPTTVWRFPIETVSLSESGCERVYQGSAIVPNWKFFLESGQRWQVTINQQIAVP